MVETTVEIANKVGVSEVISRIVDGLKDDNEPYRRMVMETIEQARYCLYTVQPREGGGGYRETRRGYNYLSPGLVDNLGGMDYKTDHIWFPYQFMTS